MARSSASRAKAVTGKAEPFGRIVLVKPAAADLSALSNQPGNRRLQIEVANDLKQACRVVREGLPDLVIAGPRLDAIRLDRAVPAGAPSRLYALVSELSHLHEALDVSQFLAGLAVAAANAVEPQPAFALLCDRVTAEPELDSLRSHPTGQPDLSVVLRRYADPAGGEAEVAGNVEAGPHLWMIPMIHASRLEGLLGVVCRPQADEPAAGSLEVLRLLAQIAAPFLAALRDAERLRRTVDELEAILQIKSHLISNVCHEFRSLLAVVRGYSKRILDERAGAISDAQRDHLTVVLRNTNRLLDLVSHSLPFVAEQQLRVERLDLRGIWQGARKRAARRASEKSIRMAEQISSEPFTVIADRERLAVMLDILLTNAIQCAADGGEITAQFLRGTNDEVTVRLFAAGEGLAPQLVDSIFEHPDESTSAHPEELRMTGLSLVHDMVWLHGGRMSVTSNPGEGTVFTFTLPPAQTSLANKDTGPLQ